MSSKEKRDFAGSWGDLRWVQSERMECFHVQAPVSVFCSLCASFGVLFPCQNVTKLCLLMFCVDIVNLSLYLLLAVSFCE